MTSSTADSTASSSGSNSPAMGARPRLSEEEVSIGRYVASILLLVSGALAIFSIFSYWWLFSGTSTNIGFFPGASYRTNGTWNTYASQGFGQVGGVFEAILVLAIAAGIVLIIGGGWVAFETFRKRQPQSKKPIALGLAGLVLEAVTVLIAPALAPWALDHSSASSTYCGAWTSGSPCSSFWGAGFDSGTFLRFVAADGWIIMIGALALSVLGIVVWRLARNPSLGSPGGA
jgi:hypothetical protein